MSQSRHSCNYCGEKHLTSQCERIEQRKKQKKQTKSITPIGCKYCKNITHEIDNCVQLKNKKNRKIERQENKQYKEQMKKKKEAIMSKLESLLKLGLYTDIISTDPMGCCCKELGFSVDCYERGNYTPHDSSPMYFTCPAPVLRLKYGNNIY